jgi:hypothetical protein
MTTLDQQKQCDFCECERDDELDEPLVPLHLGEPPQPQPVTSRGTQENYEESWKDQNAAQLEAVRSALGSMGGMEFEIHEKVHEIKPVGGETHFGKATSNGEMYFESEEKEKTSAELRFHPSAREVEPDAMVCTECAEMFRSLSE